MRKDWKYIVYVAGAIGLFVLVKILAPKQFNWSVTFMHDDKNPYGTYALYELFPDVFTDRKIEHSYLTLYELKDSLRRTDNVFVISSDFSPGYEDTKVLLSHVAGGGNAFISAEYFSGKFSDTLKLRATDYIFNSDNNFQIRDTSHLSFANPVLDTTALYSYRRDNVHNYFEKFDTTRTTVIAKNDYQRPVTIRVKWGKGNLILNSTPLAFTNIYLLSRQNHKFVSATLSHLPSSDVKWTEYYHLGRMESKTPLRFVLTNEPLRWAYYITIVSILLFMVFEAKRKQRIIPVIKPLANTTLEFVSTIGNLYYQHGDHKNIAEKKINFLFEYIRTKYLLATNKPDDTFMRSLARKSGHSEEEILSLFRAIKFISTSTVISPEQLMDLNDRLEKFYFTQSR